jgi:hypothetical protein
MFGNSSAKIVYCMDDVVFVITLSFSLLYQFFVILLFQAPRQVKKISQLRHKLQNHQQQSAVHSKICMKYFMILMASLICLAEFFAK